jgi:cell division protein FtsI/penicillin-binding protein 2
LPNNFDTSSMKLEAGAMRAHLEDGRVVTLTVMPKLQRFADELFARNQVPAAAAVVLNSRTGKVLALSQQRLKANAAEDDQVAFDASPPAASIFKIVTAAALLERGGVSIDTKTCYSGGSNQLIMTHLADPPRNLAACASLGSALGHSINAIMARLSDQHLSQSVLSQYLGYFHFNEPLPFDFDIPASTAEIPEDRLERARTAAGFWHTHLSPLHAASIVQLIAQDGALLRPYIVESVTETDGRVSYRGEPKLVSRPISKTTAGVLLRAMTDTVRTGTARKAFRDLKGMPYLSGIEVSGKTGTLTGVKPYRAYTWFVAAAPLPKPEVAIAVLVVNEPTWRIKAAPAAAQILKKYFELTRSKN